MSAYYYFLPAAILWKFICLFNGPYFVALHARLKERIRRNEELRQAQKPLVTHRAGDVAFMLFDLVYFFWIWLGLLTTQWPFFLLVVILSLIFTKKVARYSRLDAAFSLLVLLCMAANLHLWGFYFGGILALIFGR